jgi:hypothetical protein
MDPAVSAVNDVMGCISALWSCRVALVPGSGCLLCLPNFDTSTTINIEIFFECNYPISTTITIIVKFKVNSAISPSNKNHYSVQHIIKWSIQEKRP